jgi:ketosteroid isomerase-like protein
VQPSDDDKPETMADVNALAGAFNAVLEERDRDEFVAMLAPRAIVWHNHDRNEVDAVENMAAIDMLAQIVTGAKIETLLLAPTPDGFVEQFVLRGTVVATGKPFEMHNCIVVTVADGMITRVDEYVDPTVGAQLAP